MLLVPEARKIKRFRSYTQAQTQTQTQTQTGTDQIGPPQHTRRQRLGCLFVFHTGNIDNHKEGKIIIHHPPAKGQMHLGPAPREKRGVGWEGGGGTTTTTTPRRQQIGPAVRNLQGSADAKMR